MKGGKAYLELWLRAVHFRRQRAAPAGKQEGAPGDASWGAEARVDYGTPDYLHTEHRPLQAAGDARPRTGHKAWYPAPRHYAPGVSP